MKVYVVIWHNDDPGHGIEAVYSDKQAAWAEAERQTELEPYCWFTVREAELR